MLYRGLWSSISHATFANYITNALACQGFNTYFSIIQLLSTTKDTCQLFFIYTTGNIIQFLCLGVKLLSLVFFSILYIVFIICLLFHIRNDNIVYRYLSFIKFLIIVCHYCICKRGSL